MALPPPIPLRPADRPETWAEYCRRRESIAQWRGIADFVIKGHFGSFAEFTLLGPYRQPRLPPRRFVPFPLLLGGGIVPGSPKGEPVTLPWSNETLGILDDPIKDYGEPVKTDDGLEWLTYWPKNGS